MRDISCDAFEFLYESRRALAENRPVIVFPTMRRAFESTCLCHLFSVKPEFAKKWAEGREISNSEVRKALENNPMTESVEQLKELYKQFSQGTHPNRSHVPSVFLGEGNRFTLGAIPPIDPLNLGHHVRHLMCLSYWYVGVVSWFYRESLPQRADSQFAAEFLALTPRISKLQPALEEQLDRLHEERAAEGKPAGVGLGSKTKADA